MAASLRLAPPKRAKPREVPLAKVVAVALSEHLREYGAGEGGLFFQSREHKLKARTYFNLGVWKPALVKAGIEPTRENGANALRRYFATVLLDAGESIRAVSDYLGATLIPASPLRAYTHLLPSSEDRYRRAMDTAFSGSRVRNVSDGPKQGAFGQVRADRLSLLRYLDSRAEWWWDGLYGHFTTTRRGASRR